MTPECSVDDVEVNAGSNGGGPARSTRRQYEQYEQYRASERPRRAVVGGGRPEDEWRWPPLFPARGPIVTTYDGGVHNVAEQYEHRT